MLTNHCIHHLPPSWLAECWSYRHMMLTYHCIHHVPTSWLAECWSYRHMMLIYHCVLNHTWHKPFMTDFIHPWPPRVVLIEVVKWYWYPCSYTFTFCPFPRIWEMRTPANTSPNGSSMYRGSWLDAEQTDETLREEKLPPSTKSFILWLMHDCVSHVHILFWTSVLHNHCSGSFLWGPQPTIVCSIIMRYNNTLQC